MNKSYKSTKKVVATKKVMRVYKSSLRIPVKHTGSTSGKLLLWIFKNLESRGWTQEVFAKKIGLSQSRISQLFNSYYGVRRLDVDFLEKVTAVFGHRVEVKILPLRRKGTK